MFRKDRIGRRGGGVIFYIKESIQAYELQLEKEAESEEAICMVFDKAISWVSKSEVMLFLEDITKWVDEGSLVDNLLRFKKAFDKVPHQRLTYLCILYSAKHQYNLILENIYGNQITELNYTRGGNAVMA